MQRHNDTVKSTLSPLLTEFKPHLVQSIKLKKPTSTLHKPFDNINEILEAIKAYNKQLYLMLFNDLRMSFKTSS